MHGNIFASKREGNEDALRTLREVNHTSGRAPNVSLIGMSLSGAFSQGATDSQTRMAKIKFPTPISSGSLSHLPACQRWMDWHMRIIHRNVLKSNGASVASGIRLLKAKAPTGLQSDYAPERLERRSRMLAAGSRGSGSSELGILSDVEPIEKEYLLEDNQRVVNFLAAGTQEDKQRFIDLLLAKIDREWEARKAVSQAHRTLRRPDIYAYVERLWINSSLIRPHYGLPITMVASSRKKKSRHGITIRKNKQSVSTAEGSSSHLNCAESYVIY